MKILARIVFIILFCGISVLHVKAQDDLLALVEKDKPKKEFVKYAFKSPRVIMGHSMEFLNPGTLDVRILHRFGPLDQGVKNFFGLDQASMRMGFDYGILRNLMVGVGRSTFNKELDGFIKFAPVLQSRGPKSFPLTIAAVAGMTMNSMPWADPTRKNFFTSRLGYYFQTVIGRKFSEKVTLQITPTLVHENLVALETQSNDIFALGFGGRFKLSKRVAFTFDYFHNFNGLVEDVTFDPISVGFDIETGGHVFQLHFSNSSGMNERAFINQTNGNWADKQVHFGFNLSRVFQVKKNKVKKVAQEKGALIKMQ